MDRQYMRKRLHGKPRMYIMTRMKTPDVAAVKLIRLRFIRGDGVKTRCREVLRYPDSETAGLVFESDPCAGNDAIAHHVGEDVF